MQHIQFVNRIKLTSYIRRHFPARLFCVATAALLMVLDMFAHTFTLKVTDSDTGQPVEFAAVALTCGAKNLGGLTDLAGSFTATLDFTGDCCLSITAVGYKQVSRQVALTDDTNVLTVKLSPAYTQVGEVVVTAREGRGMSSTSLIDRKAMEHLQPSSFTDLMEMLPGAVSKDPDMGKANLANIRQAQNAGADGYDTQSLGTSFVVDGVPLNTNASMQATADATRQNRITTGKGVDMRALSTDDIESVEVVRGIASAEYGEVTSGLVKIKRKAGASKLQARFKADMQSQLFYIGKGVGMPSDDWFMNFSIDYLDSKIDPRNNRENFKRVTASARSTKKWTHDNVLATWNSALNYTGTFERDKNDPDLTVNGTVDYYTSSNNAIGFDNSLLLSSPVRQFFQSATLTAGLNYSHQNLTQQKTVASSRLYPMPVSTSPGSNYVGYLPMEYLADLSVDGKPFTVFVKADARFRYNFTLADNSFKVGAEYSLSKNFGRGQIYDLTRPIVAGNNTRPRAFSDVPAMNQLSAYVENTTELHVANHRLELQLGLRETQLLALGRKYHLNNRPYIDPRVNAKWAFPQTFVDDNPIDWEIAGGLGLHTKMPVAAYLYPDKLYTDYVQLNYFHDNPAYRTMNVYTFIEDITNYSLRAARNFKWEIRGDVTFRNNHLSATYFREHMTDAFRMAPFVHSYTYNRYDASEYNPEVSGSAPSISNLPATEEHRLATVSHASNSSRVKKEGVEFTYSSCRIPYLRTRVTVSGAWFRTILSNSDGLWYKPNTIVNGVELPYAGYYNDLEGSVYESFNTNFTFDTDVPRLGLNFSVAVQNMWYTSQQTLLKNGVPQYYMGTDGVVKPFTQQSAQDPYLSQLLRNYSPTAFLENRIPVATTFNIKATKKLWQNRIGIAIYVNRLVSITPDYYLFGSLRRRYTSPYFGMELNLAL